jgi:hypothetical protein
MLKATVYDRNNGHGYTLHKRAAISLNAIAVCRDNFWDRRSSR